MLDLAQIRDLAHGPGIGQRDQILLLLAADDGTPKPVKKLKEIGEVVGLRWLKRVNLSSHLGRTNGLAIRTPQGWELSPAGKSALAAKFPTLGVKRASKPAADLRRHLTTISNPQTRAFLEEAISCCEQSLWRAAVVLSWCGAVAVLHDHIVKSHLAAFNTEARRRDAKWRDARLSDDLGRMKEHEFLDVLAAISVLGKNVKQELQDNCLSLRNACGHPNSLALSEARVAAHLEILMLNVFSRF